MDGGTEFEILREWIERQTSEREVEGEIEKRWINR